ncbi:hypothetical protein RFI_35229, partial [Reticulomyxa filosa]
MKTEVSEWSNEKGIELKVEEEDKKEEEDDDEEENEEEEKDSDSERSQQITTHFQTLKKLPTPLSRSQCVLHKHELLICGGRYQRACYSYHTIKNKYKFICKYPSE